MKPILVPILFALGTAVFWGCYGPTIGNARSNLWSPFKPYVFIGLAYVVLAIIGGLIAMKLKGDTFRYTGEQFPPAQWGFLAGCLGAAGALCLTSAMMISKGNAILVMPIVFGGAVSVTALVEAYRLRGDVSISPLLWVGMAIVVTGIVVVATNSPHADTPKPAADTTESHVAAPSFDPDDDAPAV